MNQLAEIILQEIRNQGAISFARFMELALYCPVYGYYEKEGDTLGRGGDYFTSVNVGPLFGDLLAVQFAQWLECLKSPLCLVEAGAHKGHLARDILRWFRAQRRSLFESVDYYIIEPSTIRQEWQRSVLREFEPRVKWVKSLADLGDTDDPGNAGHSTSTGIRGVVFSNELFDAMPVHRFGWDALKGGWFEWGVTYQNGGFSWIRLPDSASQSVLIDCLLTPHLSSELLKALPDGFVVELCPKANQWWSEAAKLLASGRLLTLDYGLTLEELFAPERSGGTLRGYREHQAISDVLAWPGQQDITAHVNFTLLRQAGERTGLLTEELVSQERFLTRIASPILKHEPAFWTGERVRQFQTLTNPNHLGHTFRVLIQSRG